MYSRLANSSSTRVEGVLSYLINTVSTKSSYKLKTLHTSLQTWLSTPKGHYFTPDGETVLAITVLKQLIDAKQRYSLKRLGIDQRLDRQTMEKFEMMKLSTLVQLQDCLMELLDVDSVERGLSRATYICATMRRLLVDGSTSMDLEGIP